MGGVGATFLCCACWPGGGCVFRDEIPGYLLEGELEGEFPMSPNSIGAAEARGLAALNSTEAFPASSLPSTIIGKALRLKSLFTITGIVHCTSICA